MLKQRGVEFSKILGAETLGAIKAKGFTIKKTCEILGMSEQTVYRYFKGRRAMPSDVFVAICEAINMDPQELVSRAYARLIDEQGKPGSRRGDF